MDRRSVVSAVVGGALLLVGAAGCADGGPDEDGSLRVAASFYPLLYVAERVGGAYAVAEGLTAPGVEPHDLELTPAQVAQVADADLVVYLSGFQPSVDTAVATEASGTGFDVTPYAGLTLEAPAETGESGGPDPHFWLDPMRLADVGDALADRLATVDEANATSYRENAAALRADLVDLDERFRSGTATCDSRDLVVSHASFGYLGEAYDFRQIGISGLSPHDDPSPADLAAVSDFVRANGVRTIYFETLVSPDVANAVAAETGASTAVLDPLEGVTDASAGEDYLSIMTANLESLRAGQPCR